MKEQTQHIQKKIEEHIAAARELLGDPGTISEVAECAVHALRSGGKILLCGNGGSAADAQHVAAELVGRFALERKAYPAIALTANSSIVTAIGNDYGFERVFARQVEALAQRGDVVVGISTSGNSANIINAMRTAKEKGCKTIGVTGKSGGKLKKESDICFCAASPDTPRIQEVHILFWHIVCELVEAEMLRNG